VEAELLPVHPRRHHPRHLNEPGAQHSDALGASVRTELNSTYPAASAVANVQIDYARVWKYVP
jgi:hypothetical protein